jgi:hypothetical protein
MRMPFLILALVGGAAAAQIPPSVAEPTPPMVPAARPPQGPASRAARHEDVARERALRDAEKAEDRAEAARRQKDAERKLRGPAF